MFHFKRKHLALFGAIAVSVFMTSAPSLASELSVTGTDAKITGTTEVGLSNYEFVQDINAVVRYTTVSILLAPREGTARAARTALVYANIYANRAATLINSAHNGQKPPPALAEPPGYAPPPTSQHPVVVDPALPGPVVRSAYFPVIGPVGVVQINPVSHALGAILTDLHTVIETPTTPKVAEELRQNIVSNCDAILRLSGDGTVEPAPYIITVPL